MTSSINNIVACFVCLCVCRVLGSAITKGGKDFLLMMPQLFPPKPGRTFSLFIHGRSNTTINLSAPWEDRHVTYTIEEKGFIAFESISHPDLQKDFTHETEHFAKGFIIRCSHPVVVYVRPNEGDGYTALPRRLGTGMYRYVTASYPVTDKCRSYVAILTQKAVSKISVTVRVQDDGKAFFGGHTLMDGEQLLQIDIAYLNVMVVWSYQDLTGTYVDSQGDVSVFAGADCTCSHGNFSCQGVIEQFPREYFNSKNNHFVRVGAGMTVRAVSCLVNTTIVFSEQAARLKHVGSFAEWDSGERLGGKLTSSNKFLSVHYTMAKIGNAFPLMTLLEPLRDCGSFIPPVVVGVSLTLIIVHPLQPFGHYIFYENEEIMKVSVRPLTAKVVVLVARLKQSGSTIRPESGDPSIRMSVYAFGYKENRTVCAFFVGCHKKDTPSKPAVASTTASNSNDYVDDVDYIAWLHDTDVEDSFTDITETSTDLTDFEFLTDLGTLSEMFTPSFSFSNSGDGSEDGHEVPSTVFTGSTLFADSSALPESASRSPLLDRIIPSDIESVHTTPTDPTRRIAVPGLSGSSELSQMTSSLAIHPALRISLLQYNRKSKDFADVFYPSTLNVLSRTFCSLCPDDRPLCSCRVLNTHRTRLSIFKKLNEIKAKLCLNTTLLGSYTRKHESMPDERPSAQRMGYIGIGLITASILFVVLSDLFRFITYLSP